MHSKFDIFKWVLLMLPNILRRPVIIAFFRCMSEGFREINNRYYLYRQATLQELAYNSTTIMLQRWLNRIFYLDDDIYITEYRNDKTYFSQNEEPNIVYMTFQNEGSGLYLSSSPPTDEYGGFVINIPANLATSQNIETIKKWANFYKTAGVCYRIEMYE